jgi:hypothetical protein
MPTIPLPPDYGKHPGRKPGLTKQARCFLELLVSGKSTIEAYALAGYKGQTTQCAYNLRYQLRDQLYEMMEKMGLDRSGVLLEMKKLMDLPVAQQVVNVDQKMQMLKFLSKLQGEKEIERPKITPFLINVNNAESVNISKPEERIEANSPLPSNGQ